MADSSTIARPYARALFGVAQRADELGQWSQALCCAGALLRDDRARRHLARPDLTDDARVSFVESVCTEAGGVLSTEHGRNFLRLLVENDRLAALPEIAAQFDHLKARAENKVRVKVTAAAAVDESIVGAVARSLESRLGRTVELEVEVDSELMGGAVIRAEDMVIDGSLRSRLQRLAEKLIA
jgi:F-type H+-transporting ATPase subunit delta